MMIPTWVIAVAFIISGVATFYYIARPKRYSFDETESFHNFIEALSKRIPK
jgi:ABC-type Co2+ transport system permease subunit